MNKRILFSYLLFLLVVCWGCSNTKYLATGETLFVGSKVILLSDVPVHNRDLKNELEKICRPKPNVTFLGMQYKLWVYNITGKDPKKKVKTWLRKKLGEAPVLASAATPDKTAEALRMRLGSRGYMHANVSYEIVSKKGKTAIWYTANIGPPFFIDSISFPAAADTLSKRIKATEGESLLKEGMQYDLGNLKVERIRIDRVLKDEGFYYFNPDYLLFKADSNSTTRKIKIAIVVKPEVPEKAKLKYKIGKVFITVTAENGSDSSAVSRDTTKSDGCYYSNPDSTFRAAAIIRSVFLKTDSLYSRTAHNLTISRLTGMGVFKYATVRFQEPENGPADVLDVLINLAPMPGKSVQAELEAVTKSDNYTGPELTVSYKNRNLWKGAELFVLNLVGSFETQIGGGGTSGNSYEIGANSQVFIPHFITPFKLKQVSGMFVPKTKLDLGISMLNRVRYFNMEIIHSSFGYKWKETLRKEHELELLSVNFAKLLNTTPAFDALLLQNPFLKKSFQQQFILGSSYTFTYNSQLGPVRRNQMYFSGNINVAGNAIHAIQTLFSSHPSSEADPYKIGGYAYSQFSRLTTDTRYYHTFNEKHKIATRLIVGAGVPYGNSNTMPYIKEYFSGGTSSLRAFQVRSVGPGSYKIPDSLAGKFLVDQSGDIKLEGNVEYRFQIISILKGAFFADAGNIWMVRKTDQLPGGEFRFDEFYKQIAVGAGFGLRLDVTFFVLRFDLGVPLRKPYLPENERWVTSQIDFSNPSWRSNNLVLNIAIGYPF
jgi:outer membrane protein insertion porin family